MQALETSIATDGWIGAITVAADGETFDGSARVEKTAENGMIDDAIVIDIDGTRPVVLRRTDIPNATDPRAVRLGVAANRIASLNLEWEPDVLAAIADSGVDLGALFTDVEWAEVSLPSLPAPGGGGDEFDATPEDGPTRTALGELWSIGGKHRLLVGDCTIAANVARLMDGERAQGVFTSPPYDQQRTYEGNMASDWLGLMRGAFGAALPVLDDDAQVFVNLGLVYAGGRVVRYWDGFIAWMEDEDQDWPLFGWYVWDKLNGRPGDQHGRLATAHEWVFHFAREKVYPDKIVQTKGGRTGTTKRTVSGALVPFTQRAIAVQPFKIPDSVIRTPQNTDHEATSGHPAPFPLALPEMFVQAYDADIWYEPFAGSGTTLIAAHRTGRRCFGMEIAPRYADVILRRAEAEGLACEVIDG